jgi:competence protein ComEA
MRGGGVTREQERGLVVLLCVGLLVGGAVLVRPTRRADAPPPARPIVVRDVAVVVPVLVERANVDINLAGADELATLPGIGPALAARILAYRSEHGPFRTVDDLTAVKGIGPATVRDLRDFAAIGDGGPPARREL